MKNEMNKAKDKAVNPWRVPFPKHEVTTVDVPVPDLPEPAQMRRGMRSVVSNVLGFLMRLFFGMRSENAERMPEEGPLILISEHGSLLDLPLLHFTSKTWIYWLAKIELFQNRLGFRFLPWWGSIPVDRDRMHIRTARDVIDTLRKKRVLGVFPQGKRCRTYEEIRTTEPKPGVIKFALKANAKIIPVAIDGNYRIFSKNRVIYGQVHEIRLPEGQRSLTDAEERGLALEMMRAIYSLKGEPYPFEYPEGTEVSETGLLFPVS